MILQVEMTKTAVCESNIKEKEKVGTKGANKIQPPQNCTLSQEFT